MLFLKRLTLTILALITLASVACEGEDGALSEYSVGGANGGSRGAGDGDDVLDKGDEDGVIGDGGRGDAGDGDGDGVAGDGDGDGVAGDGDGDGVAGDGDGGEGDGPPITCPSDNWRDGATCHPYSVCQAWEEETEPGTETSDRVCTTSVVCPNDLLNCDISRPRLATGNSHGCALHDGTVFCWGSNHWGELGGFALDFSRTPVEISFDHSLAAVSLSHECAAFEDGTAECWSRTERTSLAGMDGSTASSSLLQIIRGPGGDVYGLDEAHHVWHWADKTSMPTQIFLGEAALEAELLGGDYRKACAIELDRKVACWDSTNSPTRVLAFDATDPATRAVSLNVDAYRACATSETGEVYCWSDETQARLLTDLPASAQVVSIAQLDYSTQCVALADGSAWCWGSSSSGQLGVGDFVDRAEPTLVLGLDGTTPESAVVELTASWGHVCALLASGDYACWGGNRFGELGLADSIIGAQPVAQKIPLSGTVVDAHGQCALLTSGAVQCWSTSKKPGTTSPEPFTLVGIDGMTAGTSAHSLSRDGNCAIMEDHTVRCWETAGIDGFVPSAPSVITFDGATEESTPVVYEVQSTHSCAVDAAGRLACWGKNAGGGVGNGTKAFVTTPYYHPQFTGETPATSVVDVITDRYFTCALTESGSVWCWGEFARRVLGRTEYPDGSLSPVELPDWNAQSTAQTATEIYPADGDICVTQLDGGVGCRGTALYTSRPNFSEYTDATLLYVDPGSLHHCGFFDDGTVLCWGSNRDGQLGLPLDDSAPFGTPVQGLPESQKLIVGAFKSCGITKDGELYCWGSNAGGNISEAPWYPSPQVSAF